MSESVILLFGFNQKDLLIIKLQLNTFETSLYINVRLHTEH